MSSPALHFSRAAQTYDRGAGLHRHVAARLVEMMPDAAAGVPSRILEVGCGTGVLTEQVRSRYQDAAMCLVDVAEGMIACVRERWGADSRMEFVTGDVREFVSPFRFDLIVSSSALHWAQPLDRTLTTLAGFLTEEGALCIALMLDGTLGELHSLRRQVAPGKVPAGRLPTRAEVLSAVRSAGLCVTAVEEESIQTHYHSADDCLRTLHAQGLTGGAVSRAGLPLTRTELNALRTGYDADCRDGRGGVYASFEVLHLCARRSLPQ